MKLWLLNESPHTRIVGGQELPLIKHGDRVDWGFEDMGLTEFGVRKLERAVRYGEGVLLTGTGLALKAPNFPESILVTASGHERLVQLPPEWMRAIYVVNSDYNYTWIGDQVRTDRYGGEMVTNKMKRVAGGWVREI